MFSFNLLKEDFQIQIGCHYTLGSGTYVIRGFDRSFKEKAKLEMSISDKMKLYPNIFTSMAYIKSSGICIIASTTCTYEIKVWVLKDPSWVA